MRELDAGQEDETKTAVLSTTHRCTAESPFLFFSYTTAAHKNRNIVTDISVGQKSHDLVIFGFRKVSNRGFTITRAL